VLASQVPAPSMFSDAMRARADRMIIHMQTNARMFQAAVRISEPHERLDILLFIDTVGKILLTD